MSEIREKTFDEPHDQEGSNRTGIYSVKMKLHQQIPEWLPLEGLKIKIQYHNIQRLTNCFGKHLRKECTVDKKTWADYVKTFMRTYPELPADFYGKWKGSNPVPDQASLKCPDIADYKLPTSQEEWDAMLQKMEECGIDKETGVQAIRKRKDKYVKALNEYKKNTRSTSNDEF